jgi:hypothetical protein
MIYKTKGRPAYKAGRPLSPLLIISPRIFGGLEDNYIPRRPGN